MQVHQSEFEKSWWGRERSLATRSFPLLLAMPRDRLKNAVHRDFLRIIGLGDE
jgi:hypothetical protein